MLSHFVSTKGKGTKRVGGGRTRARKQRIFMRRLVTRVTMAAVVVSVLGAGAWFILSDADSVVGQWIRDEAVQASAASGFVVQNFLVDGRVNCDGAEILSLMNIKKGDPIFNFDPVTAKKLVEKVSWVEKAHVERRLPDTIYIRLYERTPYALWKQEDKLVVIDKQGVVLTDKNIAKFSDLEMVSGENANEHVTEMIEMLAAEPVIQERFDVAQWIENRRWNLHLKDGKIVILPEKDAQFALGRLVKKQQDEGVLDKEITSIDARDPSRFIVQTERGKAQDLEQGSEAPQTSL